MVTFTGSVDAAFVPAYLRLGAVSVEPARTTPAALGRSPLKLVESMAAGTPVVSSAVGERISTLKAGRYGMAGLLVEPNDADALAAGILYVLSSQELAHQLRCAGARRVEDFYWDRLAPIVVRLYEDAAQ
jgi:glycosyltransferase involved in cell wall biosynthesis